MMLSPYEKLLESDYTKVAEQEEAYQFITERHVQVMWLEQKYFKRLTTSDGKHIEIISPGIWNAEAGPDFRKAHLKIGGKHCWGDVEIHLRDEGWVNHKHHRDSLYNQVVLHLSFWRPKGKKVIINEQGGPIIQSYFEKALTIPEKRITQLIDLDLYPYKKFCGSGRCADTVFKKIPEKSILQFLRDSSFWRLEKKRRHLYSYVEDPRLYFSSGIAMALGYKDNAENFLDLYQHLLSSKKCSENNLMAIAMRRCGFFSSHYLNKWQKSTYYQELEKIEVSSYHLNPKFKLTLQKIRPINHPIRRIAYLIKMLKDPSLPQLYQRMEGHWHAMWPLLSKEKDFKEHLRELCELTPTYHDEYWNFHYTFEEKARGKVLPLIGPNLKTEILINTYFPLLHKSIMTRKIAQELDTFKILYSSISAQQTRKSKYLQHRFFGETSKRSLLNKADIIQGAYQVHHDFCIHYEASCEGCPFIRRFHEAYHQ